MPLIPRTPLDRRTFLQGMGAMIALPQLEAMRPVGRAARAQQHRMSAYILGVVRTPAFRMQRPPEPVAASSDR